MEAGAAVAVGLPASGAPSSNKAANRSKSKGSKKQGGKSRGQQLAEEVELRGNLNLVRLRYEGRRPDPIDEPHIVQLSKVHKSARLVLSEDRLTVTGHKGFRSARASHGVHEGTWYCEARVTHLGSTGHVRLGWGTKRAELNAPMGFDPYGFCYRDLEGSKVRDGKREEYGEAFGEGDIIGLLVHLPPGGKPLESKQNEYTKWKGKWMRIEDPEPDPEVLTGSLAVFSKNGVTQGIAFRDFLEGTYYPAASIYTLPEQAEGASVTFNFGPDFTHPPPEVQGCPPARPMCELASAPPPPEPQAPPAADGVAGVADAAGADGSAAAGADVGAPGDAAGTAAAQ